MLSFLSIGFIDNVTALVIIFLCLFCFYLYYENKKLNDMIEQLKLKDKDNYEKNVFKEDIVSIGDISKNIKKEKILDIKEEDNTDRKIINEESYEKNDIKDDIIINNRDNEVMLLNKTEDKFEVEDFVRKDKVFNRKLDSNNMDKDYLKEVSKELANSIEPQTIKLTDYEQKQEDNAIISYKELLNVNKKEETINDGTVEFIEELKKFRNNLGR